MKTLYLSVSSRSNNAIAAYLRNTAAVIEPEGPLELNYNGSEDIGVRREKIEYSAFMEEAKPHPFADWYKRANYLHPDYDELVDNREQLTTLYQEQTVYKAKSHTERFEVCKRTDLDNSLSYAVYYQYYNSLVMRVATFDTLSQATVAVEQAHGIPLVDMLCCD